MKIIEEKLRLLQIGRCEEKMLGEAIDVVMKLGPDDISKNTVAVAQLFEEILRGVQDLFCPDIYAEERITEEYRKKIILLYRNIKARSNRAITLFLIKKENTPPKKDYHKDDDEINTIKAGIEALKRYFLKWGFSGKDAASANTLTVFSILPPRVRIEVLEGIIEQDHNFVVLEKLSKAYAKDGKIDVAQKRISEWVELGYIDRNFANALLAAAETLYSYRDRFPIAKDISDARRNFEDVLTFTTAPEEFLDIIRKMLYKSY